MPAIPTIATPEPASVDNDDALIPAKGVQARFGNISDMTLWRWVRDPNLGFPQPIYINRRRYWRLRNIKAFEARLANGEGQQ